jgi:hypothetical protein
MSDDTGKKFHEEQLEKVRNLQQKQPPPKPKFNAPTQKFNAVRRSGRGR